MEQLPLLLPRDRGKWILDRGPGLTQSEFLVSVHALADKLPARRHAIMLTHGRCEFLIAFCAALMRGQTTLLPVNDTDVAVAELAERYPDCFAMLDRPRSLAVETVFVGSAPPTKDRCANVPDIPANHVAAILHTSGSTGEPQAHEKTWEEMVIGAQRWRERFAFDASDYIVPTIPAQHMFGFEASIILPLQTGASVFRGQPLYPADVTRALGLARDATLVTTPIHLRACGRSEVEWSSIRRVICSTASLDARLAEECEATMRTRVSEIFGSTETGAIASRRTATDNHWSCLDGLTIEQRDADAYIRHSTTGERFRLDDKIEVIENRSFNLLGRPTDMIKIAGKRASMVDLNHRLNRIEGIEDGVLLCRETPGDSVDRLIALVVAPTLSPRQIRMELARQIDSAFLPRRIIHVEKLPRNSSGKLSHDATRPLLNRLTRL